MLRPRLIPTLLYDGHGLVKTTKFKKPVYIGDPINAIKIFNQKQVDELIVLDIQASKKGLPPNMNLIRTFTDECFMPVAYGGGITNCDQIRQILNIGIEKIILNHSALKNPQLITQASEEFGAQAIIVALDIKKNIWGKSQLFSSSKAPVKEKDPSHWAQKAIALGAGEIYLNNVDKDGTLEGYDMTLIQHVAKDLSVPLIVAGGAGTLEDFKKAIDEGGADAVSAGAFFVFQGPHRAVLITYPSPDSLKKLWSYHEQIPR